MEAVVLDPAEAGFDPVSVGSSAAGSACCLGGSATAGGRASGPTGGAGGAGPAWGTMGAVVRACESLGDCSGILAGNPEADCRRGMGLREAVPLWAPKTVGRGTLFKRAVERWTGRLAWAAGVWSSRRAIAFDMFAGCGSCGIAGRNRDRKPARGVQAIQRVASARGCWTCFVVCAMRPFRNVAIVSMHPAAGRAAASAKPMNATRIDERDPYHGRGS